MSKGRKKNRKMIRRRSERKIRDLNDYSENEIDQEN